VLAEALNGNQVMTELNLANNELGLRPNLAGGGDADMSGIIALAHAIPGMGAISQFTFSGDSGESKPVTMEAAMVEADFSGKHLGVSGGIMLLAFFPKCM
jgi:hypothetical protein